MDSSASVGVYVVRFYVSWSVVSVWSLGGVGEWVVHVWDDGERRDRE